MAHQSVMRTVLDKTLELAAKNGGSVSVGKIYPALAAKNTKERKRILNTLSDLVRQERLSRISQGVYGPMTIAGKPLDKRMIMKNIVNIRKRVTVEDLVEMAEVTGTYAREWLRLMTANGVLRKEQYAIGMPATWYRVREIVEVPNDTAKAEKLREIRKQKKQISDRLDIIDRGLGEIRTILDTMDKE